MRSSATPFVQLMCVFFVHIKQPSTSFLSLQATCLPPSRTRSCRHEGLSLFRTNHRHHGASQRLYMGQSDLRHETTVAPSRSVHVRITFDRIQLSCDVSMSMLLKCYTPQGIYHRHAFP